MCPIIIFTTDQRADVTLVVLSEGNALTAPSKGEHLRDSSNIP